MQRRPHPVFDDRAATEDRAPEQLLPRWERPCLVAFGDVRQLTMGVTLPAGESGPGDGTRRP